MKSERFDQVARLISNGSRRQVVSAGLAGVATLVGLATAPDTSAKRKKVQVEGPCGNGSARQNRCKRNRHCCTGFCDKKKGKKQHGRCRCRKLNQSCQEDRNCCATADQPMNCVNSICQETTTTCVPLGGACATGGAACCTNPGADATCTSSICRDPGYCQTVLEAAGCELLSGTDIWNCGSKDLTGINLSGCDLPGASFFTTNVTNAIFTSANLTGANFFDSNVTGAEWGNTTCPTGENSDANGDTCCGQFILGQVPTGCPAG